MHSYYDVPEWPYFIDVSDAARFIGLFLRKWGRVPVRSFKEKYGSVRVYLSLGWYQFHCIFYPGFAYSQFPKWLWKLDCTYGSILIRLVNKLVLPYHIWLYKLAYKKAIKKWPHIKNEILSCSDYPELLTSLE